MTELNDFLEKCMLVHGTTATACMEIASHIVPNKNYKYENLEGKDLHNDYWSMNRINDYSSFTNLAIDDRSMTFTNDDAQYYIKKLIHSLETQDYINHSQLGFDHQNKSLVAVLEAKDQEKKEVLYDFFSNLPESFNSRVLTYIS
jgi:hypothetical protein